MNLLNLKTTKKNLTFKWPCIVIFL